MKIDWKAKLTSRKFWAAIAGFVAALLTVFNIDKLTIEQVLAVLGAVASMVAYIIGEGMVDAARLKNGETVAIDDGKTITINVTKEEGQK